jgi:hypothetical protein
MTLAEWLGIIQTTAVISFGAFVFWLRKSFISREEWKTYIEKIEADRKAREAADADEIARMGDRILVVEKAILLLTEQSHAIARQDQKIDDLDNRVRDIELSIARGGL